MENYYEARGIIFDLQRFSLQDGPGIRTTVFVKGCPLKCIWCDNPESQKLQPEVMLKGPCERRGRCIEVCEGKYISFDSDGPVIDREKCDACGKCVEACPKGGIEIAGRPISVPEIMKLIDRDRLFFQNSGGGITISGGEALSQAAFTIATFQACWDKGINTTLDTCGHGDSEALTEILRYTNLVYYDIKVMDSTKHNQFTDVSNELILSNAELIAARRVPMVFRIPLIQAINDCFQNIRSVINFALDIAVKEIHLLPFHKMGQPKYRMLNREYLGKDLMSPSEETVTSLLNEINESGLIGRVEW